MRIKNEGTEAASGIAITIQVNNRFVYNKGTVVAGDGSIAPTVERFERGGLFIQFPDTLKVEAGETLPIKFQVTTP